jgi:selenocysteine-specific elongation factor
MMSRRSLLAAVGPICALLVLAAHPSDAFTAIQPAAHATASTTGASTTTSLHLGNFGKKKGPQEDLSYIETRDLTREEMEAINKQNEDIMNMELSAMTGFSLVLSIPILYLCWVAFFSD